MISFIKFLKRTQFSRSVTLLLLVMLLLVGAVPGYLRGGHWSWEQPLHVATLKQIRSLRHTGLTLTGWQTTEQQEQMIGERKWSVQTLKQEGVQTKAILLLLPQNGDKDQPQVEWTDINGWQRWQTDQNSLNNFTVGSKTKVEARFFRGWTEQQTFAVLQWYAWPGGGNPAPSQWFWADQLAQWHSTRLPWIAVSILIPIEPLGEVDKSWPLAQSIGQTVQAALFNNPHLLTRGGGVRSQSH